MNQGGSFLATALLGTAVAGCHTDLVAADGGLGDEPAVLAGEHDGGAGDGIGDFPEWHLPAADLGPARNGAEANHSKPRADIKKLPAYLQEPF